MFIYISFDNVFHFQDTFHQSTAAFLPQYKNKKRCMLFTYNVLHITKRRERDSNPRYLAVRRFSRPLQSITLPSLQGSSFLQRRCKDTAFSETTKRFFNSKFKIHNSKLNIIWLSEYYCLNRFQIIYNIFFNTR